MGKVLITEKVHPIGPQLLRAAGHQVVQVENRDMAQIAREIVDADAVIVLNDGAPGGEIGLDLARYMKCEHENGYIFGLQTQDDKDLAFTPMGGLFNCLEFAAAVQVFMYRFAVDGGRDFSVLGIHKKMNSYFDAHKRREEKRP